MEQENSELSAAVVDFGKADAMWQALDALTSAAAAERANAMRKVVTLAGSQTAAEPLLGLDQSTISRTLNRQRTLPLSPEAAAAVKEWTAALPGGDLLRRADGGKFADNYLRALGLAGTAKPSKSGKPKNKAGDSSSGKGKKPKGKEKK
ncbi:hypothetical protein [Kitasatospora cineracea]|uniref:hypothetical protein n=1 Tax=Kitasatospora cineracea TaxID=88074 RepID=UPI0036990EF1